jgi:hypothetical protein
MSMPWFRLYTEFLTDPVIRMLAPSDRAVFVDVLCMKALGVLDKEYSSDALRNAVISRYVGVTGNVTEIVTESLRNDGLSQLDATRDRLKKHGLIDENWQPLNWEKRQFQKDTRDPTGADRQRRYRERLLEKQRETSRNGSVTSIDSEQIQIQKNKRERARAARPAPRKRCPTEFQITPELMAWASVNAPDVNIDRETSKFRDWEFKAARSDWPATWRTWMRRAQESGPGRGIATWSPLRSADEIEAEEKARARA